MTAKSLLVLNHCNRMGRKRLQVFLCPDATAQITHVKSNTLLMTYIIPPCVVNSELIARLILICRYRKNVMLIKGPTAQQHSVCLNPPATFRPVGSQSVAHSDHCDHHYCRNHARKSTCSVVRRQSCPLVLGISFTCWMQNLAKVLKWLCCGSEQIYLGIARQVKLLIVDDSAVQSQSPSSF